MQSHGDSGVQIHFLLDIYFVNFLHTVHWRRQIECSHSRARQAAAATAAASAAESMTLQSTWFKVTETDSVRATQQTVTSLLRSVKKQWFCVLQRCWNKQGSASSVVEVQPGAGWAIYSRNSRSYSLSLVWMAINEFNGHTEGADVLTFGDSSILVVPHLDCGQKKWYSASCQFNGIHTNFSFFF